MLAINTNISSLISQKTLNQSTDSMAKTLERLSTGYKVNNAADGPAAFAITESMTQTINILNQGMVNGNDGVSLLQVANGGIESLLTNVQKLSELALAAQNGTYSTSQRANLDLSFQSLVTQMETVVTTTSFNGLDLLNGSLGTINIAMGNNNTISVNMGSTLSALRVLSSDDNVLTAGMTSAGASVLKASAITFYGSVSAGSDAMSTALLALGFAGTTAQEVVGSAVSATSASSYGAAVLVSTQLALDIAVATFFSAAAAQFDNTTSGVAASAAFIAVAANYISAATELSTLAAGIAAGSAGGMTSVSAEGMYSNASVATTAATSNASAAALLTPIAMTGAIKALADVTLDITTLTTRAATFGATQTNIQAAVDNNNVQSLATQAARSIAKDADYAAETGNMAKLSILIQAGAKVLQQSNQSTQIIIQLLS